MSSDGVPRCGDSGGWSETQDRPCHRQVSEEGERCPQHPPEDSDKEPAPAGRPKIELTDEHLERVETLAGFGLTQDEVCQVLPIEPRTMRDRIQRDDEFAAAYARGRAKAKSEAAGRYHHIAHGRAAGLGLDEDENVSVSEQRKALEKILGTDLSFVPQQDVRLSGPEGEPIEPTIYMPDNNRGKGEGDGGS